MGFARSAIEAAQALPAPTIEIDLSPDAIDSVRVFFAMGRQWNLLAGFAGCMYQSFKIEHIPRVMRGLKIPAGRYPVIFEDMQIMEAAALPILNQS